MRGGGREEEAACVGSYSGGWGMSYMTLTAFSDSRAGSPLVIASPSVMGSARLKEHRAFVLRHSVQATVYDSRWQGRPPSLHLVHGGCKMR